MTLSTTPAQPDKMSTVQTVSLPSRRVLLSKLRYYENIRNSLAINGFTKVNFPVTSHHEKKFFLFCLKNVLCTLVLLQ